MYSFFFFFKQQTAYDMRISDWSSDVCSSDLQRRGRQLGTGPCPRLARALPVDEAGGMAGGADPALLQDRHVDYAEDGPTVLQQRDEAAEEGIAGDEALGAVDRVQDPDELGAGILDAEYLTVDAVAGVRGGGDVTHPRFGLAVVRRGVGLG